MTDAAGPPPQPVLPLRRLGALTLFVEDLPACRAFYTALLQAEPVYSDDDSAVFDLGNTLVNLLAASAAVGMVAPGSVAPAGAGARAQLTIWVSDLAVALEHLDRLGVRLQNGPLDRPWGQRTATFVDPAGHLWELAQEIPAA